MMSRVLSAHLSCTNADTRHISARSARFCCRHLGTMRAICHLTHLLSCENGHRKMEFSVKADLIYRVEQEVPFVFNLQAQRLPGQSVKTESLQLDPELPLESWTMPESGNRYFRLIAPSGRFKASYRATVGVEPVTKTP